MYSFAYSAEFKQLLEATFGSALARQVVKHGGVILDAATVDKIIVENGRAVGVHIAAEDRVLREYLLLILATTRTNHWRRDAGGRRRSFLAAKSA